MQKDAKLNDHRDGSILKLIEMFLKAGVMIDHHVEATEIGSPQGGVISPLIANTHLDAFDQEMKVVTESFWRGNIARGKGRVAFQGV